jgi:hypothetical protein
MAATKSRKPNSGSIKRGEVRNPYGRPKDENSWAGVVRVLQDMTADEIAAMVGGHGTDLGRAFLQMPVNVQMKYLITLRAMAGLMFEPNSSLWDRVMERAEGKVSQPIDMSITKVILEDADPDDSQD